MKKSKLIALSGISCALALIFMTVGALVPTLDYSCIFMASLCTMIPLSKNSLKAGLLTYLATSLLSCLLVFGRWELVVTFSAFFGLHPTVNRFIKEKGINKYLSKAVLTVWFLAVLLLLYTFFRDFLFENSFLENEFVAKYIYAILIVFGTLFFLVYDFFITRFQRAVDIMVDRLKL